MNELEQKTRGRLQKNGFMLHNFMELDFVERDRAAVRLTIRPESKNPYGFMHGGVIFSMADNATGIAAHSDGRFYVTQSSSFHFLRNRTEGTVRAVAQVRNRGRSTCLVSVDVVDEENILLATGEFVFFCVGEGESEGTPAK